MNLSDITRDFIANKYEKDTKDIVTFIESPSGLNLTLYPVQRFIFKVLTGMSITGRKKSIEVPNVFNTRVLYRLTESDFLQFLYDEGRINTKDLDSMPMRYVKQLVIGRRGTKTTMTSSFTAFKIYEFLSIADPHSYFKVAQDSDLSITLVSTSEALAATLFKIPKNMLANSSYFRKYLNGDPTSLRVKMFTQQGKKDERRDSRITLEAIPCTSSRARGPSNIVVIMDEFAFFRQVAGSKASDKDLYKALTPSISSFSHPDGTPAGAIFLISSPDGKTGHFYSVYKSAFEDDDPTTVSFKMYSSLVNKNVNPFLLIGEYRKDPESFVSEYCGEFGVSVDSFIKEAYFDMCVSDDLAANTSYDSRWRYSMGIDAGLTNDGFGIAVVHEEQKKVSANFLKVEEPDDAGIDIGADCPWLLNRKLNEIKPFGKLDMEQEELRLFKDSSKGIQAKEGSFSDPNYLSAYKSAILEKVVNGSGKITADGYLIANFTVLDFIVAFYAGIPPFEDCVELPSKQIVRIVKDISSCFNNPLGIFDQWAGVVFRQLFLEEGLRNLKMVQVTDIFNTICAFILRSVMINKRLLMYREDALKSEVMSLVRTKTGQGKIKVEAPSNDPSYHDEMYDSLSRAVICSVASDILPKFLAKDTKRNRLREGQYASATMKYTENFGHTTGRGSTLEAYNRRVTKMMNRRK